MIVPGGEKCLVDGSSNEIINHMIELWADHVCQGISYIFEPKIIGLLHIYIGHTRAIQRSGLADISYDVWSFCYGSLFFFEFPQEEIMPTFEPIIFIFQIYDPLIGIPMFQSLRRDPAREIL